MPPWGRVRLEACYGAPAVYRSEERTMSEVDAYPPGTFCWIDLGTTDVARAKRFCTELFGWEMEDLPTEAATYTMCRLNGKAVAGMHEHSEEEGVGWTSSISVDDIDGSTSRAGGLGATVLIEPFEIPGASRMSVIRDPSGAEVQLWQPKGHIGAGIVNEVGTWTWNERVTPTLTRRRPSTGISLDGPPRTSPGPSPGQASPWATCSSGAPMLRRKPRPAQRGGPSRSAWPTPTRTRRAPSSSAAQSSCPPWTF